MCSSFVVDRYIRRSSKVRRRKRSLLHARCTEFLPQQMSPPCAARPPLPTAFKVAVVICFVLIWTVFGLQMRAISLTTPSDVWPNAGTLKWQWPASCNESLAHVGHPEGAVRGANYFTLHMFLMTLAFLLFGPIASLWYYIFEDMLGVSHDRVKWSHGTVQLGALLASVLGFVQIYFSNGGSCSSFADHFQSLHSFVGIVLLAGWWTQWPLAVLVFSNKRLLPPGTWARLAFLRVHVVLGKGMVLLGLFVCILGMLAFEVKRPQWDNDNLFNLEAPLRHAIWESMATSGAFVFVLAIALGLVLAFAPSSSPPSHIKPATEPVLSLRPSDSSEHPNVALLIGPPDAVARDFSPGALRVQETALAPTPAIESAME